MKVFTKSYGPPKSWESQFREMTFGSWPGIKNTIRGKVVASLKSRPRWVLWICVCMWLVHAPKVLQLLINQLIVWFVQVRVNNWLFCHSSESPSWSSSTPFYLWNVVNQGVYFNSLFLCCFHFWICSWIYQGTWGCINLDLDLYSNTQT